MVTEEVVNNRIKERGYIPLCNSGIDGYLTRIEFCDKYGYKYNMDWTSFNRGKKICNITYSNIYSIENIKLFLKINNINSELISNEFISVTSNLKFKCPDCNKTFECTWTNFKRRKHLKCNECSKPDVKTRILDEDFVFNFFISKGFNPLDGEIYKGQNKPVICIDKNNYKYLVRYDNLSSSRVPIFISKYNPYSIYNLNLFLKNNNSKTECLEENYINENIYMKFKCGICNKIYYNSSANIRNCKHMSCEDCAIIERGKSNRLSISYIKQEFNNLGYILLDEEYEGNGKRLLCLDSNGYKGYLSYAQLTRIKSGKVNNFDYFSEKHNFDNVIFNLNNYCKLNGIESEPIKYILDDDSFSQPTIKVKCSCGEYFYTTKNSFITNKHYCDKCNKRISLYEQKIISWFKLNNIKYQRQKKFKECRNYLPLPFDFYIKDLNILVEADGEGHYYPCNFNKCSNEQAIKSFNTTQHNDKIKTKFCEDNNIKLIRIPYWEFKDNTYIEVLNQSILNLAN